MKKWIAMMLACLLLLTACGDSRGPARDRDDRREKEREEEREEELSLVDDSGQFPLYCYEYTRDYEFGEFLDEGGARDSEELVAFCLEIFPDMELDFANLGYGCSSFCAQDEDGDILFGRNFDMGSQNMGPYLLVHTVPEDGYESWSMVNLGFLGISGEPEDPVGGDTSPLLMAPYLPLDGMNEKGLAICVLQLNYRPVSSDVGADVDLTPTTLIRAVLDQAADVEDALEILEGANFYTEGYAYHFMIADRRGNSVIVEYVDDEMVVVEMEGDLQVCANAFVSPEGREFYNVLDDNESDRRADAIAQAIRDVDFDLTRTNSLEALAAAHVSSTRWSVVYNLTDGKMYVTVNRNLEEVYKYDFD